MRIVGASRLRKAVAHQCVAVDGIDHRPAFERREGHTEDAFGEAEYREHGFAPEAVASEARREAFERVAVHRLRTVEGESPRAEIEPVELGVGDYGPRTVRRRSSAPPTRLRDACGWPTASVTAWREIRAATSAPADSRRPGFRCTRRSDPCRDTGAARTRTCRRC